MIPAKDYLLVAPELILLLAGLVVMMAEPLLPPGRSRGGLGLFSFIAVISALAASFYQASLGVNQTGFFNMLRVDSFSIFFHILILAISALVILSSIKYLEAQDIHSGEYYALILMGTVGMVLMTSSVELVLIFVALEISSISSYVLAGFRRKVAISTESSLKYFLLGSFATAFFLYGVALMFGSTGSTNVDEISRQITSGQPVALVFLAVALMFVGIGFKVAAAPFHVWTPDVYEGSPIPVVALLSTGPKVAAFGVLLRVLFGASTPGWFWLVWISAALSMTIGNFGALRQTNVKRMLAYSSIAHAGYLLVAIAASGTAGISAVIFYSASYASMNLGAFTVIAHFAGADERYVAIEDYAGLARTAPGMAATLTIFLLSLIGIPATAGFFAKFYVFSASMHAHLVWLTLIGVVNSAVASYYYLRLVVVMYMHEPKYDHPLAGAPWPVVTVLTATAAITLYLGVLPGRVLGFALQSAHDLIHH